MTSKKINATRGANALMDAWDKRTQLVKKETAAANAAADAKTVRLRALRLEKEKQDAANEKAGELPASRRKSRQIKRVTCG